MGRSPTRGGRGGGTSPAIVVKKKVRRKVPNFHIDPSTAVRVPHPRSSLRVPGGGRVVLGVWQWWACWSPLPLPPRGRCGRLLSTKRWVSSFAHSPAGPESGLPAGRSTEPDRRAAAAARPPAAPPTGRRAARGSRSVGRAPLLALAAYKWGTLKGALRPHCRPVADRDMGRPATGPATC